MFLFGIDKVVKYHMDVPLYSTVFTYNMNQAKYNSMSDAQKKVDRRPLHAGMGRPGSPIPGPISRPTAAPR